MQMVSFRAVGRSGQNENVNQGILQDYPSHSPDGLFSSGTISF